MPRPSDLAHCEALLAEGSKSFAAAARLLPRRVRTPATVLYAFLRVADDLIDEPEAQGIAPDEALPRLSRRLDAVFAGTPEDDPVDRALAEVVARHALPRAPFDALLEGFAWDRTGRRYPRYEDVVDYSVRVAGTVGLLMAWIMGVRSEAVLARACDLGVAMQLTNIARDVGEDARRGRVYLPEAWLAEGGLSPGALVEAPRYSQGLGWTVARLLAAADTLYRRADRGISRLPRGLRPSIRAARLVYADIGRVIRRRGYDSVTRRAVTSKARKLWLLVRSLPSMLWPRRSVEGAWIPTTARLLDAVPLGPLRALPLPGADAPTAVPAAAPAPAPARERVS